jgi:CheY-like chemotaxis protein
MNEIFPLILIAEDQEDLRQNLVEFLTLENYRVLAAEDGRKAFELAAAHRPDLIISDVAMPVWDGPRLLAELKTNPDTADIPLLFLSAWANREHVRRGMQLGAADYITKPFALTEITGAVRIQLEKRQALRRRMGEARDHERTQLMSLLPHEMLTPLNAILGPSELLATADDYMGMEEVRDWAALIKKNATHLTRIIEKMLIYVDLQRADHAPAARPVDAGDQHALLVGVLDEIAAGPFPGRTQLKVAGRIGATRMPDHALRRVWSELLDNACKFSTAGEAVRVEIESADSGQRVRICNRVMAGSVDDVLRHIEGLLANGPKMSGAGGGIGLGLCIAAGLLKLSGGSLHFEAVEPDELNAMVTLPVD